MTETYRGYDWDAVYNALKATAAKIDTIAGVNEFGKIEAGKPDNISLHPGDTVLIALGKIERITSAMGGKGKVAHVKGYMLIYVDGENETAQKRAAYLWSRLESEINSDSTLGISGCKCKVDVENPGGFRQNDKNMGSSKSPDYCAGAVLILDIAKARSLITV
jgi:hypothetical protein